jgi:hypothetical protein
MGSNEEFNQVLLQKESKKGAPSEGALRLAQLERLDLLLVHEGRQNLEALRGDGRK